MLNKKSKVVPIHLQLIEKLGLKPSDYSQWSHKSDSFILHQLRRKVRYACFSIQRGDNKGISKKFIKYFETQPDFSGWALFADRWDIDKKDPSKTYPRLLSIHDEWDARLKMCVPELPGAIAYKQTV